MAQDPNQPFYWNFNPAPGYNASQDPAYWAAQNEYAMNKRNAQQEADEAAAEALLNQKQANLTTNTNNINNSFDSTFTPDFYSNYAKQLMSYWQPDLDQQHTDAQHQLNYTFADAQPGGGSAASDAFGRLQKAYDTAELQANDNSQSQANQLRSNVEGQRSALLSSVSGDTDPGPLSRRPSGQSAAFLSRPRTRRWVTSSRTSPASLLPPCRPLVAALCLAFPRPGRLLPAAQAPRMSSTASVG